jgi:hypothetical protein
MVRIGFFVLQAAYSNTHCCVALLYGKIFAELFETQVSRVPLSEETSGSSKRSPKLLFVFRHASSGEHTNGNLSNKAANHSHAITGSFLI